MLASALVVGACQCNDNLNLVPGGVQGRVCDPDTGIGLDNAALKLMGGAVTRESISDQGGNYIFERVPPGRGYTLTATLGDVVRELQLEVEPGQTAMPEDTACRGNPGDPTKGTLEGQICNRHTGTLITNGEVILALPDGELMITQTNDEGRFLLTGIPQGEHVVTIRGEGYQRSFLVTIEGGGTFTLDLAEDCEAPSAVEGSIVGSFCNPATLDNLIGADVLVSAEDSGETWSDLTDTAGEFLVSGLPAGLYTVEVSHADYNFTESHVPVSAGAVEVVLDPTSECGDRPQYGRIEGQICDLEAGGRFVGDVDLIQGVTVIESTVSDSDGRFAFNAIQPGIYSVRAHVGSYERIFTGVVVEPFATAFLQESDCPGPEDVCTPHENDPMMSSDGRILLVVDRSGSMGEDEVGSGQQKWQGMKNALINVTSALDATVEFGLMLFPNNDECGGGSLRVTLGANKASAIQTALNGAYPSGGTPTASTLQVTNEVVAPYLGDGRPLAVLLATDGGPNCETGQIVSSRSPTCRCTNIEEQGNCLLHNCLDIETDNDGPITEIGHIKDLGISTFVVGISGVENFADVLNSMATVGGTALPGATKYYEANNEAQLQQALEAITQRVLSCRINVGADLDSADSINVRIGDMVVTRDSARQNGWDIVSPGVIELFGAPCDIASSSTTRVTVETCMSP
ncbi:MAG: carboxypeptidase regulatory-like domain-containing protein [Deltaproteobacteria bacterium]|nr:carboxypeptidase regulatory-like domain-containing protein [Deltaproteobacteria bacterium]